MSISFLAAAVAALAAAVGAGLLVRDCVRLPRIELVPWLVAAAGLTIALAAEALGYSRGFGPTTFRAVQLGAQLLAPLALVWGLVEVTAVSAGARFAGRLVLAAVAIVAGVVLATDPLSSAPFSKAWPAASAHYQIIPNGVLLLLAALTVTAGVVAVIVAAVRRGRAPAGRDGFMAAAAGAVGVVATALLRLSLPVNAGYPALCLAAAALAWFAGTRSDLQRLPAAAGDRRYGDEQDDYAGLYREDDAGYRGYRDDTGYGEVAPDTGYGAGGPDTGWGTYGGRDVSDTGYGFYRDDTGGLRAISDTGYGLYRDDTGGMVFADGTGPLGAIAAGDTGFGLGALAGTGAADEAEGTARLYGQIAIYTLLDGRAAEFDELAQDVVAKVKAREPETLVYVMHGVPSAPMQRILYEVYRDQAAYGQHAEQVYIRDFEEQRKPYVLATNVIELGVRQAKVSPLAPGAAAAGGLPPGPPGAAPVPPARVPSPAAPVPPLPRTGSLPGASAPRRAPDPDLPRSRRGPDPDLPRSHRAPDPDLPPSRRGPDPDLPRSRRGPDLDLPPSRQGADADLPPSHQPLDPGPPRSRRATEAGPPRSRRSREAEPRSREAEPRSRRAPEPPPDGDFWTRAPADPDDDDGDFWTREGPYR